MRKSRTLPRHINVLQEVCVGVWRDDCDLQDEMSVTAWYGLRNGQCYVFHRHRRGLPLSLGSLLRLYFLFSV